MKHLTAAAAFTAIVAVSAAAIAAQDHARLDSGPLPERFAYSEPASASAPSAPSTSSLNLCGLREQMVQDLNREFREQPLASGLVDQNAVMEIFVSPGGTWTILATGTDGLSCVMAVGEGFDAATPRIVGVGA